MGVTEQLARFVVETNYNDFPKEVVEAAKIAMLDCLGCTFAGAVEPQGKIVIKFTKELGGAKESGVVGGGFKTNAPNAAFANGNMAHILDYDDILSGMGHPSVALLPAVLALGEKLNVSGKDLLASYILGFEVQCKLGAASVQDREDQLRGFHATPVFGTIGATAGAAKLLGLNVDETRNAFGIAASLCGGVLQNAGTMTKPMHAGNAARNGVWAALLAREGFTGNTEIIEASKGMAYTLIGPGRCDLEKVTKNLGKPYSFISPGLILKKYPSCGYTHPAIDATLDLMQEHKLTNEKIAEVEVAVSVIFPFFHSNPKTVTEGRFSHEFNLAGALVDGGVGLDTFSEARLEDPKMKQAQKKVKVKVDPELAKEKGVPNPIVTFKLTDGRSLTKRVEFTRGYPQNPLSQQELLDKYLINASQVLNKRAAEQSAAMMTALEDVVTFSQLAKVTMSGRVSLS